MYPSAIAQLTPIMCHILFSPFFLFMFSIYSVTGCYRPLVWFSWMFLTSYGNTSAYEIFCSLARVWFRHHSPLKYAIKSQYRALSRNAPTTPDAVRSIIDIISLIYKLFAISRIPFPGGRVICYRHYWGNLFFVTPNIHIIPYFILNVKYKILYL